MFENLKKIKKLKEKEILKPTVSISSVESWVVRVLENSVSSSKERD